MPACEQVTRPNRSRSTGQWSCSPSAARRDPPRSDQVSASSYHRGAANLPTFSYEPRLEIHDPPGQGIALQMAALDSSQSPNGIVVGWNPKGIAVTVRNLREL